MRPLILAVVLCVGLGGCASEPMEFTAENDGGRVSLGVGDVILVTLPANPTTGYDWSVAELDEKVMVMTAGEFAPDSDALGAGGSSKMEFEAVGQGTTTVHLIYHRAFEDAEPIDNFRLTVTVE